MGNILCCKKNENEESMLTTAEKRPPKKKVRHSRKKQLVLDKDRKIIQKEKELYQVIYDPEGISVHDLALLGQKNVADGLVKPDLKPKKMGRVTLMPDIQPHLTLKAGTTTISSQKPSPASKSTDDFEISEVEDYVDDLYLQLMDPDRDL
ncbi:MADS-box domain-containing protein [Caenorhabditis elegans]|uniref:MADS-box domain-containing protein n=1 Tax=Caenorhabditis elegans TaxID=6239 RepID=A4V4W5_CAEEL|nr:MADS-box domain-containing protein [Caenorhabditis elegans]CCD72946.2 MADS-box domain-containing protein [Caenorhabditis elegans]|eukprot:NP_001076606.3 Uncharacterized protein CELE_K12C11.5 [Caenorhabditis elegans]